MDNGIFVLSEPYLGWGIFFFVFPGFRRFWALCQPRRIIIRCKLCFYLGGVFFGWAPPSLGDHFLSSAGTERNCALAMRLPNLSPPSSAYKSCTHGCRNFIQYWGWGLEKGSCAPVGACAMTTKYPTIEFALLHNLLSWRLLRKTAFLRTIFLSAPNAQPLKNASFICIVVSASLNLGSFQTTNLHWIDFSLRFMLLAKQARSHARPRAQSVRRRQPPLLFICFARIFLACVPFLTFFACIWRPSLPPGVTLPALQKAFVDL